MTHQKDPSQLQKKKKKQKVEDRLEFEVGKVFGPGAAEDEELEVEVDAARFKARHGQSGDRNRD